MYQTRGLLHPSSLDHVPGERGPPAGDAQLLKQLPHLLLSQQAVQVSPLQALLHLLNQHRREWRSGCI